MRCVKCNHPIPLPLREVSPRFFFVTAVVFFIVGVGSIVCGIFIRWELIIVGLACLWAGRMGLYGALEESCAALNTTEEREKGVKRCPNCGAENTVHMWSS